MDYTSNFVIILEKYIRLFLNFNASMVLFEL